MFWSAPSNAARKHGGASRSAGGEGSFNIGGVAGINYADGKLAIIRSIGGVESARSQVKQHVAADRISELGFKFSMRCEALVLERLEVIEDRQRGKAHSGMVARRKANGCALSFDNAK